MSYVTVNSIDIPVLIDQEVSEGIEPTEDHLYVALDDQDFIDSVNQQISRANEYWDKLRIRQRRETNYKYWFGDQVDTAALRDDLEKGVDNVIFRNLETLIPIVTARTPELIATAVYKNDETRAYAKEVERALPAEWEVVQHVQPLVGQGIRNHQLNFIACYQYGYDPDKDEFWTEEISATDLIISRYGDFIARVIKSDTVGDLIEKFPDKKKDIAEYYRFTSSELIPKKVLSSPAEYYEVWTDEMVGWKLGTIALGKMKNPHFDYDGREITMPSGKVATVKYNHFKNPKKPFLFITYFGRGLHIMDDTTLVEQGIGAQDWVNKRKRQIGANADSTNGHWVSSGDFISREEFDKITGGIDEKIWLENGMPSDGLSKITGQPLPDYIYNDLIDSRNVLDNLMGVHSTTRGEASGNSTATQDIVQKDQDYGRVDGYIRDGVEVFSREWFEAMYHMMLVYRTEDTAIATPEDDDFETDNLMFSRDRVPLIEKRNGDVIPVPLVFKVKQGSTLPDDEVANWMRAKEMKDILSPMDFFKMSGVHNPRELTRNLLIWQTDPYYFFKDDPEMQQILMAKQQQEMQAAQAQAMAEGKPAADTVPPVSAQSEMPIEEMQAGGDEATAEGTANALNALLSGQA